MLEADVPVATPVQPLSGRCDNDGLTAHRLICHAPTLPPRADLRVRRLPGPAFSNGLAGSCNRSLRSATLVGCQALHLFAEHLVVIFNLFGADIAAGRQHELVLPDLIQRHRLTERRLVRIGLAV